MYKLAAFDIDGTLVNDQKVMTPKTVETLRWLHDQGTMVVICSGRPVAGFQHLVDEIGRDVVQYGIGFNGGLVKDLHSHRTLASYALQYDDLIELQELGSSLGLDIHTFDEDIIITPDPLIGRYIVTEGYMNNLLIEYRPKEALANDFYAAKVMYSGEPHFLDEQISKIPKAIFDKYYCTKSLPYFFEIMPQGVNKGLGLGALADSLGIKPEEIIAFGDANNDLTMIEYAGTGVAMGNATGNIKRAADFITKTNNEDGIAYAVEQLFNN